MKVVHEISISTLKQVKNENKPVRIKYSFLLYPLYPKTGEKFTLGRYLYLIMYIHFKLF